MDYKQAQSDRDRYQRESIVRSLIKHRTDLSPAQLVETAGWLWWFVKTGLLERRTDSHSVSPQRLLCARCKKAGNECDCDFVPGAIYYDLRR